MNSETTKYDQIPGGHTLVLDERGEGQEQLIKQVLGRQIAAGGAVVVIGASVKESLLTVMIDTGKAFGRSADLLVVNPFTPAISHTYNPVLHTAPGKVASHVLNFISDQDTDGFCDSKPTAALVRAIVSCLQLAGLPYSYLDLGMFVMKPDAISALCEHMTTVYPGSVQLGALQQACKPFLGSEGDISSDLLKTRFSGLAGSMCMLGSGKAGEVFNSYQPDVVLHDALATRKIVYLAIPYIGRGAAALNLRRIVISNLADAVLRSSGGDSAPAALAVFTDPGGCNDPSIEQLLSAETENVLNVWISAGSLDDLGRESLDLREACLSHARNLVLFKPETNEAIEIYAQLLQVDSESDPGVSVDVRKKLVALSNSEYVAISAENQVVWGEVVLADPNATPLAVSLSRPTRHFHARMSGADQFTQTVPV